MGLFTAIIIFIILAIAAASHGDFSGMQIIGKIVGVIAIIVILAVLLMNPVLLVASLIIVAIIALTHKG